MTTRHTYDGKQYAPDMELAREHCTSCGMEHMVSYRVVEVVEQHENGEFSWRTPDNESNLRIIMTSSPSTHSGESINPYGVAAPTESVRIPAPTRISRSDTTTASVPPGRISWTEYERTRRAVQAELSPTLYNAPSGDYDETSSVNDVPADSQSLYSHNMDTVARTFSNNLRSGQG